MPYVIVLLAVIILSLGSSTAYLLTQNAKLKHTAEINNAIIDAQNKAIEQIALESENYHCSIDDMNNFSKNKYTQALKGRETDSCEGKLKSVEKAFQIFSKGKSK